MTLPEFGLYLVAKAIFLVTVFFTNDWPQLAAAGGLVLALLAAAGWRFGWERVRAVGQNCASGVGYVGNLAVAFLLAAVGCWAVLYAGFLLMCPDKPLLLHVGRWWMHGAPSVSIGPRAILLVAMFFAVAIAHESGKTISAWWDGLDIRGMFRALLRRATTPVKR